MAILVQHPETQQVFALIGTDYGDQVDTLRPFGGKLIPIRRFGGDSRGRGE